MGSPELRKGGLKKLIDVLDQNGDNQISIPELSTELKRFRKEQKEKAEKKKADDAAAARKRMEDEAPARAADSAAKAAARREAFKNAEVQACMKKLSAAVSKQGLHALLSSLDRNADGIVSPTELHEGLVRSSRAFANTHASHC